MGLPILHLALRAAVFHGFALGAENKLAGLLRFCSTLATNVLLVFDPCVLALDAFMLVLKPLTEKKAFRKCHLRLLTAWGRHVDPC